MKDTVLHDGKCRVQHFWALNILEAKEGIMVGRSLDGNVFSSGKRVAAHIFFRVMHMKNVVMSQTTPYFVGQCDRTTNPAAW